MKDTTRFSFAVYEDPDYMVSGFPRSIQRRADLIFDSSDRWNGILYEFAKFLGYHYGYDITDRLFVKDFNGDLVSLGDSVIELGAVNITDKKKCSNKKNFIMGSVDDWEEEE